MPSGIYRRTEKQKINISLGLKKAYAEGRKKIMITDKIRETMRNNALNGVVGMKGKRHAESTKNKMRGVNNPNWKGGLISEDKKERVRFKKTLQKEILKRDDFTCQICLIRGKDMQVDHVKSWSAYPELRFEASNCRTLCKPCHYLITYKRPLKDLNSPWGHNLGRGIVS